MAVVYAARHLVSGRTRALKIARREPAAEEALRGEYEALTSARPPQHRARHRPHQDGRGAPDARHGARRRHETCASGSRQPDPRAPTQRRLAEDLLAGLDYLEQQGVTHKDLKPDNLLVGDGRLTIIDFSLAGMPEDAPYGGTALYRDPTSARWTHATDRYAAALCLFELYAGRHAFDGRVPEPGQSAARQRGRHRSAGPRGVLRKALSDPVPEQRFPSARAMRDALLVALGDDSPELRQRAAGETRRDDAAAPHRPLRAAP
jgi:hypothetical protein